MEMVALTKITLGFAIPAWGILVFEGYVLAAAVGVLALLLLAVELRSGRFRGKSAERGA